MFTRGVTMDLKMQKAVSSAPISFLLAGMLLVFFLLSGCASGIQKPNGDDSSLAGIVSFTQSPDGEFVMSLTERDAVISQENPDQTEAMPGMIEFYQIDEEGQAGAGLRVASLEIPEQDGERQLNLIQLPPGWYRILVEGQIPFDVRIPPGSIVLLPQTIIPGGMRPLSEEDAQFASDDLLDYTQFYNWAGHSFYGFGDYIPKLGRAADEFRVTVITEPANARVIFAGKELQTDGETPAETLIENGRHLVEVRAEGFAPARILTTINSDTELHISLSPAAQATNSLSTDEYGLAMGEFVNLGSSFDDNLKSILGRSLGLALTEDPRISRIGSGNVTLEEARELGAELYLTGYYHSSNGEILLQANLYDTATGGIKAGQLYTGSGGLAMFSTIDTAAADFAAAVDRVLPDRNQENTSSEATAIGSSTGDDVLDIAERQSSRQRASRNGILSACVGFGGMMDMGGRDDDFRGSPGPELLLSYTKQNGNSGLRYMLLVSPRTVTDLGIGLAPELILETGTSELFVAGGLLLRYGWPAPTDIGEEANYGPEHAYYYAHLFLDTGVRFYTHSRHSQLPKYFFTGMLISPINARLEDSGTFVPGMPAFYGSFYLGYGVRL